MFWVAALWSISPFALNTWFILQLYWLTSYIPIPGIVQSHSDESCHGLIKKVYDHHIKLALPPEDTQLTRSGHKSWLSRVWIHPVLCSYTWHKVIDGTMGEVGKLAAHCFMLKRSRKPISLCKHKTTLNGGEWNKWNTRWDEHIQAIWLQ